MGRHAAEDEKKADMRREGLILIALFHFTSAESEVSTSDTSIDDLDGNSTSPGPEKSACVSGHCLGPGYNKLELPQNKSEIKMDLEVIRRKLDKIYIFKRNWE